MEGEAEVDVGGVWTRERWKECCFFNPLSLKNSCVPPEPDLTFCRVECDIDFFNWWKASGGGDDSVASLT